MKLRNAYIFHNVTKPGAVSFRAELELELASLEIRVVEELADADFFIVLGGDGTLLNFSKLIINHPHPVVAVNMGSLGFLTDVRVEEAKSVIEDVSNGRYETESRRFLEICVKGKTYYALNDFVISKCGVHSRMVSVAVTAAGEYVNTYRADGVIIASPTGSTAYSFSTGGPIVKPGLDALIITPIAPHNLNARPIVVPGSDVIEISSEERDQELHVMLDGQCYLQIDKDDTVAISLSNRSIQLIKSPSQSYYGILRKKLKWGDKLF